MKLTVKMCKSVRCFVNIDHTIVLKHSPCFLCSCKSKLLQIKVRR